MIIMGYFYYFSIKLDQEVSICSLIPPISTINNLWSAELVQSVAKANNPSEKLLCLHTLVYWTVSCFGVPVAVPMLILLHHPRTPANYCCWIYSFVPTVSELPRPHRLPSLKPW